jgi:hypothetical protein
LSFWASADAASAQVAATPIAVSRAMRNMAVISIPLVMVSCPTGWVGGRTIWDAPTLSDRVLRLDDRVGSP